MVAVSCELVSRFPDVWSAMERRFGDREWLIVADRNLLERNPASLRGLRAKRRRALVELRGGEAVKSLGRVEALARAATGLSLGRDGLVVALGGGTIGDLAGFFASVWMRGVDWVPVATTTLSIADSAVGGKTAVDFRGTKNLLGSFHDPVAVYGVREALATLPPRHYRAGLAEVVKAAVIADAGLFEHLEASPEQLSEASGDAVAEALLSAARIKSVLVTRDPRERGDRAFLNFGHTVGHALEAVHRPPLFHGEAVAAGMIAASWLSERLVEAPEGTTDRVAAVLHRLGLLRALSPVDDSTLWGAMSSDKKIRRKRLRLALCPRIGSATVVELSSTALMGQAVRQMRRRCAAASGEIQR